jgi:H/ACA ribonucleoprotein complex subunit 4
MTLPFQNRQYQVLNRQEGTAEWGKNPTERTVKELLDFGVINLNKPKGPTSHMASDYVQKVLGIPKAGHGGTLDPGVTGVLPVALGKATKILQALLPAGKEYITIAHLHTDVTEESIRAALLSFIGDIEQMPPVRSAVKRQLRTRTIYELEVLEVDGRDVLFRVACQGGTYVRTICTKLGQKLGTKGHMAELIRTQAGPFFRKDWITLQDLEDAWADYQEKGEEAGIRKCIQPFEHCVNHLQKIVVDDGAIKSILNGVNVRAPGLISVDSDVTAGNMVAIMSSKGELLGLGTAKRDAKQMLTDTNGTIVSADKVFHR